MYVVCIYNYYDVGLMFCVIFSGLSSFQAQHSVPRKSRGEASSLSFSVSPKELGTMDQSPTSIVPMF